MSAVGDVAVLLAGEPQQPRSTPGARDRDLGEQAACTGELFERLIALVLESFALGGNASPVSARTPAL